jgi:hypothetical protein
MVTTLLNARLLVRMPEVLHAKLALSSSYQSRSMNDLVVTALAEYFGRHPVPTDYADAMGMAQRIADQRQEAAS